MTTQTHTKKGNRFRGPQKLQQNEKTSFSVPVFTPLCCIFPFFDLHSLSIIRNLHSPAFYRPYTCLAGCFSTFSCSTKTTKKIKLAVYLLCTSGGGGYHVAEAALQISSILPVRSKAHVAATEHVLVAWVWRSGMTIVLIYHSWKWPAEISFVFVAQCTWRTAPGFTLLVVGPLRLLTGKGAAGSTSCCGR